jgi:hypothetical protein
MVNPKRASRKPLSRINRKNKMGFFELTKKSNNTKKEGGDESDPIS